MGHEIFTLALDSSLLGSIPHRVTGELAYFEEYIQNFKCIRELKRLWLKFKKVPNRKHDISNGILKARRDLQYL